jgi:hypothetical protein
MFSMCGVSKARFLEQVRADPQTYKDWGGNGEWDIVTDGKEDDLFSPFLRKPFKKALEAGLLPSNLHDRGDLGLDHRPGRSHLSQPRPFELRRDRP